MKTKDIQLSDKFIKHYKLRIRGNKNLEKRYIDRLNIFLNDPSTDILKLHKLKGKYKGLLSFSIAGDLWIILQEFENYYIFYDIGSHNQVYK